MVGNSLTAPASPPCLAEFQHINRYWDPTRRVHMAKILPGQFYVTTHAEFVATVLGSCVSACIRDQLLGIGGMNHFMLPDNKNIDHLALGNKAARYGSFAMEQLINSILKLGGHRDRLEIKLTGGGNILANSNDIGAQNSSFVKQLLAQEGLPYCAEDLGGNHPRKVIYDPKTGSLKVKKLKQLANDTVFRREREYEESLQQPQGEVELF